jgi:dolichol-phosphate mannosyltransferase
MSQRIPKLLSVVVPCFNEQEVLNLTHGRLTDTLGDNSGFDLEIVYVNDGSEDRTEEILFGMADTDARVKVISLSRNFGHQAAITAGLNHAVGNIVAVIDADLQDPPELILSMIKRWREGYDVVYGVRTKRKEPFFKRFAYKVFYRFYRFFAQIEVPIDSGDFALLDRRVVDILNALPERNQFIRGLRAWAGFRQTGLVYERDVRAAGQPKYNFQKLMRLAFDGIFNFSTRPLTIIFIIGLLTSFMSVLATLVYLIARIGDYKIFGYSPGDARGFTSLILAILFFSGIQLISLGIIGEYLGRLYQEIKRRPAYVVKESRGKYLVTSGQAQHRHQAADRQEYDPSKKKSGR